MSTGTELVMLLRERAPLAVAMTASAQPNKVLTPRTTVARSKSGVSGRNIMYFIRGVSDHPTVSTARRDAGSTFGFAPLRGLPGGPSLRGGGLNLPAEYFTSRKWARCRPATGARRAPAQGEAQSAGKIADG